MKFYLFTLILCVSLVSGLRIGQKDRLRAYPKDLTMLAGSVEGRVRLLSRNNDKYVLLKEDRRGSLTAVFKYDLPGGLQRNSLKKIKIVLELEFADHSSQVILSVQDRSDPAKWYNICTLTPGRALRDRHVCFVPDRIRSKVLIGGRRTTKNSIMIRLIKKDVEGRKRETNFDWLKLFWSPLSVDWAFFAKILEALQCKINFPVGSSFQWQLEDYPVKTSVGADVFEVDLYDTSQSTIDTLHNQGKKVICYMNAGATQDRGGVCDNFPGHAIGKKLDGYPEYYLDIRKVSALAPVLACKMDLAVQKKCDAVEPDNVDAIDNDSGFPLTYTDQLIYNRKIAQLAHQRNLCVALKNDVGQVDDLVDDFDFAVNESCWDWDECDTLLPFINNGKPVYHVEYKSKSSAICSQTNTWKFSTIFKPNGLDASYIAC